MNRSPAFKRTSRLLAGLALAVTLLSNGVNVLGQARDAAQNEDVPKGRLGDLKATWETDTGRKVSLADLDGKVRVVSMFFATCQGICLTTLQDMQALEASLPARIRDRVGFVLATLDGEHDQRAALHTYRRDASLSETRWTLLRSDPDATTALAKFLGVGFRRDGGGRFVHSSELVIVDESGRVLHRYNGVAADLPSIAAEIEHAVDRHVATASASLPSPTPR